MAQITFTNKDDTLVLDHPNRLLTDDNVNEIKSVVNANANAVSQVTNTSDADKPVSTAQATAIAVVQNDVNTHEANTSNPHGVTKAQVGLSNVTNDQQQPIDGDLTAIAAISPTNDDIIQRKAGAWTNRSIAQLKVDLALNNVTNVQQQPLDSDLTFISGLSPINDDFLQKKAGQWTNRTIAQVQADLGITLLTSFVDSEVPAGAVNSSNVTFTLANTPVVGSVHLYRNGMRQKAGGVDYSISGLTITFVLAPDSGDLLLADYRK